MKRIDELFEFIGANKKKEIIKIIIINLTIIVLSGLIYFFLKQLTVILFGIMILCVANYLVISSYSNKKKKILRDREDEFIVMIGYFQIYISNSYNVYQALKALTPYASTWMEEQLQKLILEIDNDKSVQPFINFAEKFTNKMTSNVMLTIYQMVDEGESSLHMMQFTALFQQLSKNHQKQLIDDKERSLSSIATLPLIGAGAITVLLTFGIISIVGEMINVI